MLRLSSKSNKMLLLRTELQFGESVRRQMSAWRREAP